MYNKLRGDHRLTHELQLPSGMCYSDRKLQCDEIDSLDLQALLALL